MHSLVVYKLRTPSILVVTAIPKGVRIRGVPLVEAPVPILMKGNVAIIIVILEHTSVI